MAGLRDLKRRIVAIKGIENVTKAMSNIAAAKLTGAQVRLDHARRFTGDLEAAVFNIAQEREETPTNPRYLIFGSDRGLCGSVNTMLARSVVPVLSQNKEEGINFNMILFGDKMKSSHALTEGNKDNITASFVDVLGKLNFKQATAIADSNLATPETDNETFFYQKMVSTIKFQVAEESIPTRQQLESYTGEMEVEGDNDVYTNLTEYMSCITLYRILLESETTEHYSRKTAMQNANKAAGEMVLELEMKFRRLRQAKITTEICEICTGAEAVMESED